MVLAASMMAFSIGHSKTLLIVGRFIQGASAASVTSVGLAILVDAYGDQNIGLAMGVLETSAALGSVSGPVTGGLLYHYYGYSSVFLSAYILIALDLAFRLLMLERNEDDSLGNHQPIVEDPQYVQYSQTENPHTETSLGESVDETSSLVSSHTAYGAILNDSSSVTDVASSASSSTTTASDAGQESLHEFSSHPQRCPPIIELLLMPRMQVCILGNFIYNVILNGLEAVLPLQLKTILAYNSKEIALVLSMLVIPCFGGILFGHLGDKYGPRRLVVLAFVGVSPLLVSLRIMAQPNFDQAASLCILLLMIGTCLTVVLTSLFLEVKYLVDERVTGIYHYTEKPRKPYAEAYALMAMACATGSLCGPLLGGLNEYVEWSSLTLGAGLLCAVTAIPSFLFLGGSKKL